MINYSRIFDLNSYSMKQNIKDIWFFNKIKKLSLFHYKNCKEYNLISKKLFDKIEDIKEISKLPFIHTELFKSYNLNSNQNFLNNKVFKSSGTTKRNLSRINIDFRTSILQSKALRKIYNSFFENLDQNIFFLDSKSTLEKRDNLSAKDVATKGFNEIFKNSYFLINKDGNVNFKVLLDFIKKNKNETFVIFGFTSFIWQKLFLDLRKKKIRLPKNNGIVIHGGGWKKLKDLNVSKKKFKKEIKLILGINKIYNYYGMIEQPGSIFFECEEGYFHTSVFSEILFRDKNFKITKKELKGQIQLFSLLPLSYPGHNILTEDTGILKGIDNCKCLRKGKYFELSDRINDVELRGCSDV